MSHISLETNALVTFLRRTFLPLLFFLTVILGKAKTCIFQYTLSWAVVRLKWSSPLLHTENGVLSAFSPPCSNAYSRVAHQGPWNQCQGKLPGLMMLVTTSLVPCSSESILGCITVLLRRSSLLSQDLSLQICTCTNIAVRQVLTGPGNLQTPREEQERKLAHLSIFELVITPTPFAVKGFGVWQWDKTCLEMQNAWQV